MSRGVATTGDARTGNGAASSGDRLSGTGWRWRWARIQLRGLLVDGELRVLGLALICAVAATSAVTLFSDRIARAIAAQSGETLGADLIISSRTPMHAELQAALDVLPLQQSPTVHLPSVVWHGDHSELVGLKAVQPGYPLKGELRTSAGPMQPENPTQDVPAPGEAWVDSRLWSQLRLQVGSRIEVGAMSLTVTRLLNYEPDRGSGFVDMAPRLLIHIDDLSRTALLGPGSRVQYRLLLSGPEAALAQAKALPLPRGSKLQDPASARPEIRSAMDRAGNFLALAALCASLLGGVAIALCAQQYGHRLQSDVALLRCLGAGQRDITLALCGSLLAIALIAGGLGAAIGLASQWGLGGLADVLLLQQLPPVRLGALAQSWLIALILLGGFALPPILRAATASPIGVFQDRVPRQGRQLIWSLAAIAAFLGLLALQLSDLRLIGYVVLGQLLCAALLAGLALMLIRLITPLRGGAMRGWRIGLGNLLRRPALTLAQCVSLGLGLLALLLLGVVRNDLLEAWQDKLPPQTPNQFLINIQPDQVDPLRAFLSERDVAAERIWPMARARLTAINGDPVSVDDFEDPETQRWINRDFNLSWTDNLGPDNKLLAGEWWGPAGRGQPWLSADSYARERLQLELGDRLTLDFAGEPVSFEVRSFREVDWESFQPNFFLICPPGVIDDKPATWLTSVYLPPERRGALRDLAQRFPNVTVIDLEAMMAQVRAIMDRIVGALELVFGFTVLAGLTVLLAAMEAGRSERAREIALMRTLGAGSAEIRTAMLAEFAALGLLSGLIAAICAQAVGWLLARFVFEFAYQINLVALLLGALMSAMLVCAMAWLSLRRLLNTPPDRVLRN